jgi:hypothetical protein
VVHASVINQSSGSHGAAVSHAGSELATTTSDHKPCVDSTLRGGSGGTADFDAPLGAFADVTWIDRACFGLA